MRASSKTGQNSPGNPPPAGDPSRWKLSTFTLVLALLAFVAPLTSPDVPRLAGLLLLGAAGAEALHGFRRTTVPAKRAAWTGSGVTLVLAMLLLSAPLLAGTALALFIAAPFAIDGVRYIVAAVRLRRSTDQREALIGVVLNLGVVVTILLLRGVSVDWTIAIASGLRMLYTTWEMIAQPVFTTDYAETSVVSDLALPDSAELSQIAARIEGEEVSRAPIDRAWLAALVTVLLAIHLGRMGLDRSALGLLSPVVAALGDLAVAIALAFAVITPSRLLLRRLSRGLERRAWRWKLEKPQAVSTLNRLAERAVSFWLESRMRFAIRLRMARYDLRTALRYGLRVGLPLSAVLVATVPVWGMSWYFDTENWAAGIWDSWAAARTDSWRAAMVRSVTSAGLDRTDGTGFTLQPPDLDPASPFSFIVIGDPGEGDASQHVLRDQLIRAAEADDVRFVVISSDVIYPTGAMKDYESKFWLPFKGLGKPVYAIPGNHDWYDALEGFVATFFEPQAARLAMRARIENDAGLSSTTDATIEEWIAAAARLRQEYGVPTGFQRAPFFQLQTDGFALLAVDTGVLRTVDEEQLNWLRAALEASRGKLIMVVLGHPFFAGGHDTSQGDQRFAALRDLLRQHDVKIVMAGDTHDLEYYREVVAGPAGAKTTHHWVNGGGGAYLSFGTSLAWPATPVTPEWAFYPTHDQVVAKIRAYTPWWKWPAWVWTREFGAWPASAEWLSAMFDYNVAPFFQSFVVVTVDPVKRRVTIRPWGVHGPLPWKSLQRSAQAMPEGASPDQPVEWVIE